MSMKTKKVWVPFVGSLVLAVVLLGFPVSVQAGPVQGDDVSATAPEGLSLDTSSLAQLWNELLVAVGLASSQNTPDTLDPAPPIPIGSSPTEGLTTEEATIDTQGDWRGTIQPDG